MAFKPSGSLDPHGAPLLKKAVLVASSAFTVNNLVEPQISSNDATSEIQRAYAGNRLLGCLRAIVTFDGVAVTTNGSGAQFTDTYTTASDNVTTASKQISGIVDISKFSIYSADTDGTYGTSGSDQVFNYCDIIDWSQLDESAASDTQQQFHLWGTDPADSTNALCNIYESWVFGV